MPRSRDFERENKPRGRTREEDAERKRRERARKAKLAGREPGRRGRVGKRDLVSVFASGGCRGEWLKPDSERRSAGEWIAANEHGMSGRLSLAFRGDPLPCRLVGETRRNFACVVRRLPETARTRTELDAARRELARSMIADLAREYPDARVVLAAVPRRLETTAYGVQRRGGHGVAALLFLGRPPRAHAHVAELERGIADRCGWPDVEPTDVVPFSDGWRLIDQHGEPMHRARRGAGAGARRRADLAWLGRSVTRLTNAASVFVGTGIGCEQITTSSEISQIGPSGDASDTRPKFSPVRREIRQESRGIANFVVAGAAA